MNKNILLLVVIAILIVGGFLLFNQAKPKKSQDFTVQPSVSTRPTIEKVEIVEYKASFAIFTNGTFRVFTAAMYHNQSGDVYIQTDNPNIIYVKKNGTTWDDFFKTLPFKLTKTCLTTGTGETFCTRSAGPSTVSSGRIGSGQAELRFYLNGAQEPNALDKQINNGDRLLVSYGNENEQQIEKQIQKITVIK